MKKRFQSAEIIAVGTEILLGDIINTNAAVIARGLAALGIPHFCQSVVGDNAARLTQAVSDAFSRSDLVVFSGGLGPTYDDITRETVSAYFSLPLELNETALEHIRRYFEKTGKEMPAGNDRQAMAPRGATVIQNEYGTAPGLIIEKDSKVAVLMPGPPRELVPMFDGAVTKYLSGFSDSVLVSRNLNLLGIGESAAAALITDLMENAVNPTVAPYCLEGEVRLRVSARAKDSSSAGKMCDEMIKQIEKSPAGKYIYGIDTTPAKAVIALLRKKGLTVATAESCTGGLISKLLTDVPGCSDVFCGGVVSYSNDMKKSLLSVSGDTLDAFGAVSEQTAREMVKGALDASGADIAVSVTGIAGPGGGSDEKPVGTVYIGIGSRDSIAAKLYRFSGNRSHIRMLTAMSALRGILLFAGDMK